MIDPLLFRVCHIGLVNSFQVFAASSRDIRDIIGDARMFTVPSHRAKIGEVFTLPQDRDALYAAWVALRMQA